MQPIETRNSPSHFVSTTSLGVSIGVSVTSAFMIDTSSLVDERFDSDRRVRLAGASAGAISWTKSFFMYSLAPRVTFGDVVRRTLGSFSFLTRPGLLDLAGLFDLARFGLSGDEEAF